MSAKAKQSAVERAPEKIPPSTYPPETAEHLTWSSIRFIKSPTSHMLDVTCAILFGAFLLCLVLSRLLEVDVSVPGAAEISASGGVKEIVSPLDGMVTRVFKKTGETVKRGELIARLQMDAATPEEIQELVDTIDSLTKKVETQVSPIDLDVSKWKISTAKIYEPVLLQALANVEHSIHNFQADRTRTLALINQQRGHFDKNPKKEKTNRKDSEVYFANRRIELLTKRLGEMKASPDKDLLTTYIDATEEELGRLKTQVSSAQTKANTTLDQTFSELLRTLRLASGALDNYRQHHEIKAPIPGIVGKIIDGDNIHVTLNRPIATIIPENSRFIAHIRMKSKDLVRLKKGQTVFYKVEAYPFQRYGLFTGEVVDFDQLREGQTEKDSKTDSKADSDDSFILSATINIPDRLGDDLKKRIKFIVGMRAEATVVMGRKTINEVMLEKFFNAKEDW